MFLQIFTRIADLEKIGTCLGTSVESRTQIVMLILIVSLMPCWLVWGLICLYFVVAVFCLPCPS